MRPIAVLRSRACASSSVEFARDLPEQHARSYARRFGAPGQHDDQIGTQRGKLVDDIAARALAQAGQHHHRRDTDGHRQDHQQRARAAAAQTAGGELQHIDQLHTFNTPKIQTTEHTEQSKTKK